MDLTQTLEIATCTDPGMVRSHNEDSIAADPANGLVVLAAGMGTTLVVCLFYDNRVLVAHLGDSRLYLLRESRFRQVTRDHSLLQEQIDSGIITPEQAKKAAHKNLVTKALGIDPVVEPEIHEYPTKPGDIYLLCFDGLCGMVDDEDIGMTLS